MNATTARQHTIAGLLRRTARRSPNKTAIICGDTVWCYAEFDRICDRLARGLSEFGIRGGDKVAILARNSHAFVALRFALARLGAIIVPVNFMLKANEVAYILEHSEARLLVVDGHNLDVGREASRKVPAIEKMLALPAEDPSVRAEGLDDLFSLLSTDDSPFEVELSDGAVLQIIYTSGTESLPKGAILTHDAVIAQYNSCLFASEYSPHDIMLHALPLFHCAQLDAFFGPCIYAGLTCVISSNPTPETLLDLMERYSVTSFFAPPTIWISLLRSSRFDDTNLSSMAKCFYGASIMPVAVLEEMQRKLPGVRFWNYYGQTEIAPTATILGPEDQIRKAGSAGKAVLNVETRIVDDEGLELSPGQIGEIVHRSPQLLTGYLKDETRTAEAFAGGWFHSGDLGIMDEEGYITVVDRKKDMIKTGGENVASREVEEAIYRLEGISEVAVIGLSDPYWVEAVTAIVVLKPGFDYGELTVIEHCRSNLAGFKSPKKVFFADRLPRNPSGKILKRELRQHYESSH